MRSHAIGWAWVLAGWAILGAARAAGPDTPNGRFPGLVAEGWRADQGLPHDGVTALCQTRDGYLWVGTEQGLARFDGVRFATFTVVDTPEFGSSRIRCLLEDHAGTLWIGTDGGGLVSYRERQFTAFTTKSGLSSDAVTCLAEAPDGSLWVGTASGLSRLAHGRFATFYRLDGLPDDRVDALCRWGPAGLLVATRRGLARVDEGRVAPFRVDPRAPAAGIEVLVDGGKGGLWAGGETGAFRLDSAAAFESPARGLARRVLAGVRREDGDVCLGTTDGEIFAISAAGASTPRLLWRFSSPVRSLYEDREGNLWVGTAGEGLQRLKPRVLWWEPLPDQLEITGVLSLCLLDRTRVCLASGTAGLVVWEDGQFRRLAAPRLPEGTSVGVAVADPAGGLWVGTQGDGLFHWDGARLDRHSPRDGLSDSVVEVLLAEGAGRVWVGTRNGGLNRVEAGRVTRYATPWGFGGACASALALDGDGALWIGTTGDGLFKLTGADFTAYGPADGLPSGHVRSLVVDTEGRLWIATAGGLVRFAEGRLAAITARHGLPDSALSQLQDDGLGNLWMGCNQGIFRCRKEQLNAVVEGRARMVDPVVYGKTDGLPPLQCLPGVHVVGARPVKRVWFSTTRGLVLGNPEMMKRNALPPPVWVEQVVVGKERLVLRDPVRIPAGRETLQIEYTALSLTAPEKVRFRYRLEGLDRDWSEVGSSRVARYTKVPPGRYRFRVGACNEEGAWNEAGASVALVVVPFWWASGGFRLAVLGGVGLLAVGLVRMQRARQREIERLRVRIANDLHDDVGSSLWSITLLSRLLEQHGQVGSDERRDLAEIHRIATHSANSIRDIVWLINPAYDTAQDLVLRMRDFCRTALRGTEHRLSCDGLDLSRRLPLDFRQQVFMMFKEAITNVAKHAQASRVEVHLAERPGVWQLRVQDNGRGFDPEAPRSGMGLGSLRRRAEQAGGTLSVQSRPGEGTVVAFTARNPRRRRDWRLSWTGWRQYLGHGQTRGRDRPDRGVAGRGS